MTLSTDTATRWSEWNTLVGRPPQGLHIIIDKQVGEGRGELRSVNLLADLGLQHFTYVSFWHRAFAPVDYTYTVLHPGSGDEELLTRGHLVQLVNQATENLSPHGFISNLVLTTLSTSPLPFFVLVLDSQGFHFRDAPDGKSMIEDLGLRQKGVGIYSYEMLYRRYRIRAFPNSPLSDGLTMNLWFHRLASELRAAGWTHFNHLADLFRFTERDYPLVPSVLRLLRHLLNDTDQTEQLEREGPEYVRKELKPWMETGEVMAVAHAIWWGCTVINYDLRRLLERSEHL